ncbi:MAG: YhjD/YihY/BrkB family envelope integrity protein [Candidatus Binataceae bacterium]
MHLANLRERIAARPSTKLASAYLARLSRLSRSEPVRMLRSSFASFNRNDDLLWASALTYTSGLSIVPVLALALSALKGFGEFDRIQPIISRYLAANSPQIADQILNFAGNVSARALGEVGGAVLLVTVVLTLSTIENAFNTIFHVSHGRTWLRKFSDYLSVTFTVPLLIVAAVPIKSRFLHELPHLPGLALLVSSVPIWAGFLFLYVFFPNTRVRWRNAALGSLVASILLQIGQWAYIYFQVGMANYRAIYGALAAVPILLTWIYMAWVIVLYGAELTAVTQGIEPSFDLDHRSPAFVRTAALLAVFRAGERMHQRGARACTVHSLAAELGVPETAVYSVVERLKRGGIIVESADADSSRELGHGLYLALDSGAISIAEVLGCLETAPARGGDGRVAAILEGLTAAEAELLGSFTVLDLIAGKVMRPSGEQRERNAAEQ